MWRALADDAFRAAWWPDLELDVRPGGRFVERWRDRDGVEKRTRGEVLEAVPPRLLRLTWRDDDWPAATEVLVSLEPIPRGTRITLRHDGWDWLGEPGRELRPAHEEGWRAHLDALARFSGGVPR